MGYGDDIMATAEARSVFRETGKKVVFGKPGQIYWSEVFKNNPYILQENEDPGDGVFLLRNYPGSRPYVLVIADRRIIFNPAHRAVAGDIFLTSEEIDWAAERELPDDFHLIEPHVKGKVSADNKNFGWAKWQKYLNIHEHETTWIQVGPAGTKALRGALHIETPTFRHALAVLRRASWFVGTDGGLHHAAAAFGIPGTVVWGGFSPPDVLGYQMHYNIGGGWCGALDHCDHCRDAMDTISVRLLA